MSDIEKAFRFLHDEIPQWLEDASAIEAKITNLQTETSRVPAHIQPVFKKRSGSMESIRDVATALESPLSPTASHQLASPTRKRKQHSIASGQASGPSKYRSRLLVLVFYDGQIQKSFDTMVRAIGTGRNMLRKGKMVAKMEELADMAGSDNEDDDDDEDNIMSKISYRHRSGLSSLRARGPVLRGTRGRTMSPNSRTPIELFDSTDKLLEQAQALCERAAHQLLRDGDCRKELSSAGEFLREVYQIAQKQVALFPTLVQQDPTDPTKVDSTPAPVPVAAVPVPVKILAPEVSKGLEIEVDDDEDDDSFVMPPVRMTSRLTARA